MFIGLDLGTTNLKAAAVDARGEVLARASRPIAVRHVPGGGVEQDIEEMAGVMAKVLRTLAGECDLAAAEAVGVSAQGGALQILDAGGRPVGPVISWMDGRGRPFDEAFMRAHGPDWMIEHIGHGMSALTIGQILRLRQECPERLWPGAQVGFVGDVLVSRLCGVRGHDATSLSLGFLYNPRSRGADAALLAELGLTESQLPRLLDARTPAGNLTAAAAHATGLPAGIPVSPAVHDQYAAALAVGVVSPGRVMIGTGTAWVLLAVTESLPRPVAGKGLVCTHVIDGLFGQILSMGNGGASVTWACGLVGMPDRGPELEEAIGSVEPGAEGVRFWPLLAGFDPAGVPPGATGRFTGLRLGTTPRHLVRAVVEGVVLELGRHLCLWRREGLKIERLILCGGAAAGTVTPQIVADVAGVEVACTRESEASALGAAILARGLVEPGRPLAEIALASPPAMTTFRPGLHRARYAAMLDEYVAGIDALAAGRIS
jgi:sugar (pentulose or hexulose) kinase